MTLEEYKAELRLNRGKLSSKAMENAMETIYTDGSMEFSMHIVNSKDIGLEKAANIAFSLSVAEQTELMKYISGGTRTIMNIDLKVMNIIGSR